MKPPGSFISADTTLKPPAGLAWGVDKLFFHCFYTYVDITKLKDNMFVSFSVDKNVKRQIIHIRAKLAGWAQNLFYEGNAAKFVVIIK